jgi:integrase
MRWQDIDLSARLWTIPAAFTKSNRAHVLPITPMVADIIGALPRVHETWLFPARGDLDQSWFGFNKSKPALDRRVAIDNWTLHDLRRTAATGMAKLRVPPHVVERILNHTGGSFAGVAGIYNRYAYGGEMHAALEVWQRHLSSLLTSPPTSLVGSRATMALPGPTGAAS